MAGIQAPFPPLPPDTAGNARALFHFENLYLRIGDHLDEIIQEVDLNGLDASGEKPVSLLALLAMVSIFQYVEMLPDHKAADGLRTRMDWKYALHLGVNYPGLNPIVLCEFRRRLVMDAGGLEIFQSMMDRLALVGLFGAQEKTAPAAIHALRAVCVLTRQERVLDAFHQALEAIAVNDPDWLRTILLPHWFERYNRRKLDFGLPQLEADQLDLARSVGSDAAYLLSAVDQAAQPALERLAEVQSLRRLWRRQLQPLVEQSVDEKSWLAAACESCLEMQQTG